MMEYLKELYTSHIVFVLVTISSFVLLQNFLILIYSAITNTNPKNATTIKPPFDNIPMLPNCHPLLGHLISESSSAIISQMPSLSIETLRQHSKNGISSIWYLNHPVLIVFDPKNASTLLHSYADRNVPRLARKHISTNTSEKNILLLNGREWRMYRSAIHKSMTSELLKEYQSAMIEYACKLTKSLKDKISILNHSDNKNLSDENTIQLHENVHQFMKMVTMDIFFRVSIGMDLQSCETLQVSKLAKYYELNAKDFVRRLFINPLRPWNYFYCIPSIDNIKRWYQNYYFRSDIGKYIQEKRSERIHGLTNCENAKKDILSNMLAAQERGCINHEESLNMTNDEFLGLFSSLLNAGFETTSTTLTYALYNLSRRPDIQQHLFEEIQNTIVTNDKEKILDLEKLVLCKAIINETLRLFPTAPQTTRAIRENESLELNDLNLHGPFSVRIPIWAIHRDEENFPRPEEFLPERWVRKTTSNIWVERFLGDNSREERDWNANFNISPANRAAFFAFSAGARNCVGKKFAYQEAIIILAISISDLKFEVEDGYVCIPQRSGVIQSPKDGMPMKISQRIQR